MRKTTQEVVVAAYGRSAVAKAVKGSLANVHPVNFAAQVLKGVLDKIPQLPYERIEDVIVGTSFPERNLGNNIARQIVLRAGLPSCVPGQTLNRYCSSGLQAIAAAANAIAVGECDIAIGGGVEVMDKMTMSPDPQYYNPWIEQNTKLNIPMGITAENVAEKYQVTRQDQDAFSVQSHVRAAAARAAGRFKDEIIPIQITAPDGTTQVFDTDECIRENVTAEGLASLKTVFRENGTVTAGNASQLSDGTGFVVLMSADAAEKLGVTPLARFIGYSVVGVDPEYMGIGPILAVPKVLQKNGLSLNDIDVFELNEAFASQSLAVIRTLSLDPDKVNPNGGAIAMGHPLGGTGAILSCKLLSELRRRENARYGIVTMCIGGGQGAAGIYEIIK